MPITQSIGFFVFLDIVIILFLIVIPAKAEIQKYHEQEIKLDSSLRWNDSESKYLSQKISRLKIFLMRQNNNPRH